MLTNWYVLKVMPGKERSIAEHFNTMITLGKMDNINRFVCPLEKEFIVVKNKKVLRDKVLYSGYVYFETKQKINDGESKEITQHPNVMSMFGNKKPQLMNRMDVDRILKDEKLDEHKTQKTAMFVVGEQVMLTDGPFATFNGSIMEIKGDKVDVQVKIFGRLTPVTIDINHINKV